MIGNPYQGKRFKFQANHFGELVGFCDGVILTTRPGSIVEGLGPPVKSEQDLIPWAVILVVETDQPAQNGIWLRRPSEIEEIPASV